MPEPVQYKFGIASQTLDCTEPPDASLLDKCKIAVYEDREKVDFNLVRVGRSNFQVAPEDAERIQKNYPKYHPPLQKLKDFLLVSREFYGQFGDRNGPTNIVGGIRVLGLADVYSINDYLINFIANGNVDPKTPAEKSLHTATVANSVAAFADPTMGILIEKLISRIRENTQLSPGARARAQWLQRVIDVRSAVWNEIKPKMEISVDLASKLKASTQNIITFLFSPQILEGQDARSALFNENILNAAQKHHDILSEIDASQYSVDQNYYSYMAGVLRNLKRMVNISDETVKGYDRRLNLAIGMMEAESKRETARLLPYEDNLKAFKTSLILKYGDTLDHEEALRLLLEPITVKNNNGQPSYVVPMATIDRRLREWVDGQPSAERKRAATESILYVLDQTMERGEKMTVYWQGDYRQVDSFFGSDNFEKGLLGGNNNRVLQALIVWARSEADEQNIDLAPGHDPHVALRKWTLASELGVMGVGVGTYFIPYSDPQTKYYGHGASVILAGSGAGAAAGNFLSYKVNAGKNAWLYDVGGAILGGVAAGLIYGLTTTKPDMAGGPPTNPQDPGDRIGKTPFGP